MDKLLKRLEEIESRQREILGGDDKVLSAEDRAEFDSLETERVEVEASIAQVKEDQKRREALAARNTQPRRSQAAQPGKADITVKGLAAADDPAKGFKAPREFLLSVMNASLGQRPDERLSLLKPGRNATAGSDEHGEYSDGHGGYLVPEAFLPGLMSLQAEADPTAGRTTRVPMTAGTVHINARTDKDHTTSVSGGLRVYRRAETQDVTPSRMQTEQIKLTAHGLMGVSYATEELLSDSPISFTALLEAGFRDEFGAKILREKLRGTGTGEYEGVLNTPSLVTVAKATGQSADTILYANIVAMRARCWGYGNAVWIANHDTLPQLYNLADDFGRPLWKESAVDGEPDRLLGRPIYYTEFASTVGDVGDILLANWSQYLEGWIGGITSAESMHVRFLEHERAFRFYARNDGRSWWRSALTPAKSAATLSPFVTLAAR